LVKDSAVEHDETEEVEEVEVVGETVTGEEEFADSVVAVAAAAAVVVVVVAWRKKKLVEIDDAVNRRNLAADSVVSASSFHLASVV
jgi:hypothetical protein